jgi:hypothetical protein
MVAGFPVVVTAVFIRSAAMGIGGCRASDQQGGRNQRFQVFQEISPKVAERNEHQHNHESSRIFGDVLLTMQYSMSKAVVGESHEAPAGVKELSALLTGSFFIKGERPWA